MSTQQIINLLKKLEEGLVIDHFTGNHGPNKLHISDGLITLDGQDLIFNFTYKEGNNGDVEHTLTANRNLFNGHIVSINLDSKNLIDNPHINFKFHIQGLHERLEFDFIWDADRIRIDGTLEEV